MSMESHAERATSPGAANFRRILGLSLALAFALAPAWSQVSVGQHDDANGPVVTTPVKSSGDQPAGAVLASSQPGAGEREELTSKRTTNSRTFREPDGTETIVLSVSPDSYFTDGEWRDIDTTVGSLSGAPAPFDPTAVHVTSAAGKVGVENTNASSPQSTGTAGDWVLGSEANTLRSYFAGSKAEVRADGASSGVTFSPELLYYVAGGQMDVVDKAGTASPRGEGSTVTYFDVFAGVDAVYDVLPGGLRQQYVFRSAPRAPQGIDPATAMLAVSERLHLSQGAVLMDATGREIRSDKRVEGNLQIRAGGNDSVWIAQPYALDSSGINFPEMGAWNIRFEDDGSITLASEVAYSYFAAPERVYPIVLDPDLNLQPDASVGKDAEGVQCIPSSNYGTYFTMLTNWSSGSNCDVDGFVEFDLSPIPAMSTINTATLEGTITRNTETSPIGAYRVSAAWNEATLTWNNKPGFAATPTDQIGVGATGTQTWDVQADVQAFSDGSATNYGWALSLATPADTTFLVDMYSSDHTTATQRPKISINYTVGGGGGGGGGGAPVQLQFCPEGAAGEDTELTEISTGSNWCTSAYLTENWGAPASDGLIRFDDISMVPAGATVNSATLSLYHAINTDNLQWGAYEVNAMWDECTATWGNQPLSTIGATPVDSVAPGASGDRDSWDVTASVQAMVDGTIQNFGWRMREAGENGVAFYYSSDIATAGQVPCLDIEYVLASAGDCDSLGMKIEALGMKIDAIESKLDTLDTASQGSVDAIESKLDANLDTTVSSRASQTSVNNLQGSVDALESKIDNLDIMMEFDDLGTKIGALGTKIDAIEAKLDNLDIQAELAPIEAKLDDGSRFTSDSELSAQTSQITNLVASEAANTRNHVTTEHNQTRALIQGVEADVAAIETKIDNFKFASQASVDAIEAKLDDDPRWVDEAELNTALTTQTTTLQADHASLEAKLDDGSRFTDDSELAAQTAALQSDHASLEAKLDDGTRFTDDSELAAQTQALTIEHNQTQSDIAAVEVKLDQLDTDVASLEAKLDDATRFTDDAERAALEANLTSLIQTEHSTTRAHVTTEHDATRTLLNTRFDAVDAAIAAVEAKLDDIDVSLDVLQQSIDALESKVDQFQADFAAFFELWCRLQIEHTLRNYAPGASGGAQGQQDNQRVSLYYTPASSGTTADAPLGLLEKLRDIINDVLNENAAMGYVSTAANDYYASGLALYAAGDWKGAFDDFRAAYQEITSL